MTNESEKASRVRRSRLGDDPKTWPDIFDDFDCRPGPSRLDPDYSDSLIPEHMREKTMAVRRKRREASKQANAPVVETDPKPKDGKVNK